MLNKIIGNKGEVLTQQYILKKGYKILFNNFRNKIGEIDIIAKDKDTIVFIEVKTRNSTKFGLPRESVNEYKQHKIKLVAQCFIKKYKLYDNNFRFDVVEVLNDNINYIENAFC